MSTRSDNKEYGKVYLIGVGPGDIELLTLKAVRCIGLADVILLDGLANPEVMQFARPDVELIKVGKRGGRESTSQSWIQETLISRAKAGQSVARVKGGDPGIFARGGEELEALLAENIEVCLVPGITSGVGVAASLGIPLTHRDLSHQVWFLPGPAFSSSVHEIKLGDLTGFKGTIVIYMGLSNLADVTKSLLGSGLNPYTQAAAIQSGTLPESKSVFASLINLDARVREAKLQSPVLLVIGEVVRLSPQFAADLTNRPELVSFSASPFQPHAITGVDK